jgi:hypothetical protein
MSAGQESTVDGRLDELQTMLRDADAQRQNLMNELENQIKALDFELGKARAQLKALSELNPLAGMKAQGQSAGAAGLRKHAAPEGPARERPARSMAGEDDVPANREAAPAMAAAGSSNAAAKHSAHTHAQGASAGAAHKAGA